jgi:hypothetical protein
LKNEVIQRSLGWEGVDNVINNTGAAVRRAVTLQTTTAPVVRIAKM